METKPVCIIPARGGSKRVLGKNVAEFNGKPLIAWSIRTAIRSNVFSSVIVSTDDERIASVAKENGAEIPFMRNAKLADDHTGTAEVLVDALSRLQPVDYACCLYPTAPLVTEADLQQAFQLLVESDADSVVAVTEFDFPPMRAFARQPNNRLTFQWPEYAKTRSQDLPELIHDAGAFYFFKTVALQQYQTLITENSVGYSMPRSRAVDIDTPDDLALAKTLHSMQLSKERQG